LIVTEIFEFKFHYCRNNTFRIFQLLEDAKSKDEHGVAGINRDQAMITTFIYKHNVIIESQHVRI